MALHIKNGTVYDPLNGVEGEEMDIFIDDNGRIVEDAPGAEVIDAKGKLVYPGGIDAHTHIAGSKVNAGRIMSPGDARRGLKPGTEVCRFETGLTTPNVHAMGYRYAKLGYTSAFEAAVPMLGARHSHEELREIPIIDKAGLTLFGNNWKVLDYAKEGDIDKLAAFVAWGLQVTRGYGVKVVNPGGGRAFSWGKNVDGLDDPVPDWDVTPREIITGLAKANEALNLPHSMHLHTNNLGLPGNYENTIETWKALEGIEPSRDRQLVHTTHVQFCAYGGDNWMSFESAAGEIADYINKHDHVTMDMGQLVFGHATTMTGDGPVQYRNARMFKSKWSNKDVECEEASGVVPLFFSRQAFVNAIQWAIGLELALLTEDPWKCLMTTDHPNGGPFEKYPEVIALLMSARRREEELEKVHKAVQARTSIASLDREMDWNDIAINTRAAHAKVLGFDEYGKGHLGVGAHGDVAIYDLNPADVDPSAEHEKVKNGFQNAAYTIKGGEIVVRDGEVVSTPAGSTYWVDAQGKVVPEKYEEMMEELRDHFARHYTVQMSNYPVQDAYLPKPAKLEV